MDRSAPNRRPLGYRRPFSAASPRLILFGLLLLCITSLTVATQPARPVVHVVPITGVIDLGLAPFLGRVLDDAARGGAAAVILDINTLGGRVDAAVVIRDTLLDARVQTVAFVNRRAISAGALIALAANRIAMADGGTIGAATPVELGLPGGPAQPVAEKTVSYLRKEFRATAEARKRPPMLAEAMVDADVAIPDVIDKGKLLTLTTDEALHHKLADFRANTLDAVLAAMGIADADIRHAEPSWAERVVRFLTHPTVSSLLIMIGIVGIITEIRTPGFGLPGAVGIASVGLFFWGHWLVQLAGWEELLLVVGGIALLILEIFVTPGFGLAGILGITALLGGFALSLVGAGATSEAILRATGHVIAALLIAIAVTLALLRFLPRTALGRILVLEGEMPAKAGYQSTPEADRHWLGRHGVAASTLRPAGVADLEGNRVDVVSDGEFIEAGTPIVVTRVDGNRIVVRREHAPPPPGG
jgi:membrane-bound serine protease (ClpP class)